MSENPESRETKPHPAAEERSTSVDLSNVLEKGMVIDSAVPITPATTAPTQAAQPPAAPVEASPASANASDKDTSGE
ncbi:MAG: hypothetical protein JO214_09940 [Frankiaceae bacterium]|nr:hypothetical protein [Frankiaceae bacterium]